MRTQPMSHNLVDFLDRWMEHCEVNIALSPRFSARKEQVDLARRQGI